MSKRKKKIEVVILYKQIENISENDKRANKAFDILFEETLRRIEELKIENRNLLPTKRK